MSTHVYDTTAWTQQQRNMLQAGAVALLAAAGITYSSLAIAEAGAQRTLTVQSPSSNPTTTLSQANVEAWFTAWAAAQASAAQAAAAETDAIRAAAAASRLRDLSLAEARALVAQFRADVAAAPGAQLTTGAKEALDRLAVFCDSLTVAVYYLLREARGSNRP